MSKSDFIRILSSLPFLDGAKPETIERLATSVVPKSFQPGEIILQEGSVGREVILVTDGMIEVVKGQGDDEILIARRGAGEVFGEMGFIDDRPRVATIRASQPTQVLEISEAALRVALSEEPELLFRTTHIISMRLREAQQKMIEDLQHKNRELLSAYQELKEAQSALIQKERLERDLELARALQHSFLPQKFPKLSGISFAARSRPARQVGGDFYDVIPLSEQRVGLVIADVSDKGIAAALFMALSRSLVRAEARRSTSPRQVLLNTNRLLLEISESGEQLPRSMFVTIFYGVFDAEQSRLIYARAGHEYPLLYQPISCTSHFLESQGAMLGLFDDIFLEEASIELRPGNSLLFYTDGVTEARSSTGEFFGVERLSQSICEAGHLPAPELCDFILERVDQFQPPSEQYDDIALLVMSLNQGG